MDEALLKITTAIKEEDPEFHQKSVVEIFKYENALFAEHKLQPHFEKSYNLLLSWPLKAADSNAEAFAKNLKAKINNAVELINQMLKAFTKDRGLPQFGWPGDRSRDFILTIGELASRPAGLRRAIALVVFLGSY